MQLENEISVQIKTFKESLCVDIDWDTFGTILCSREYVDYQRVVFWDKAFKPYLSDNPDIVFFKGDNLLEIE